VVQQFARQFPKPLSPQHKHEQISLYKRLGGEQGVEAVLVNFFDEKLQKDELFAPVFLRDYLNLKNEYKVFLTFALGGAANYEPKLLKNLEMSNIQWNTACNHLRNTLEDLEVSHQDIMAVIRNVSPLLDEVVKRSLDSYAHEVLEVADKPRENISLFDKLGGKKAMNAIVNRFYHEKVLKDSLIMPFFEGKDIEKLKAHQIEFLKFALGGCEWYNGRSISAVHQGLGIGFSQWQAIFSHLIDTLKELHVSISDIEAVEQLLKPLRRGIIQDESIYEKIGGKEVVKNILEDFFEKKILKDTLLAPFFVKLETSKMKNHLGQFLAAVLGGALKPSDLKDKISVAHKGLGLQDIHWRTFVKYLIQTLRKFGLSGQDVKEVYYKLKPFRSIVVWSSAYRQRSQLFLSPDSEDEGLGSEVDVHVSRYTTNECKSVTLLGSSNEEDGSDDCSVSFQGDMHVVQQRQGICCSCSIL